MIMTSLEELQQEIHVADGDDALVKMAVNLLNEIRLKIDQYDAHTQNFENMLITITLITEIYKLCEDGINTITEATA